MTVRTWRIVKHGRVRTAFEGIGSRIAGGRWNSPGRAAVYVASSLPLAALETLVHLPGEALLSRFVAIPAEFDDSLMTDFSGDLSSSRQSFTHPDETRFYGDQWLERKVSAVLRVPSVLINTESNFVLNPAHPDFARIVIGKPQTFRFDPRFRK